MPKTSDAIRAAINRERTRNMKSVCMDCRNNEPVEYIHEPGSNIASWRHADRLCAADAIRNRAMQYGPERIAANPDNSATCYLERSAVRDVITGVSDEHVHVTEGILADIDKLPILTLSGS